MNSERSMTKSRIFLNPHEIFVAQLTQRISSTTSSAVYGPPRLDQTQPATPYRPLASLDLLTICCPVCPENLVCESRHPNRRLRLARCKRCNSIILCHTDTRFRVCPESAADIVRAIDADNVQARLATHEGEDRVRLFGLCAACAKHVF